MKIMEVWQAEELDSLDSIKRKIIIQQTGLFIDEDPEDMGCARALNPG